MKRLLPLALLTAALLTPIAARADLTPRQLIYQQTLSAAEAKDDAALEAGLAQLEDYPLRPYIEYARLRADLDQLTLDEVLAFSARYPDLPLEGRLRWQITTLLGARGDWAAFNRVYPTLNRPSTEQQCYAARAQLAAGERTRAFAEAARLWVAGHSQPNACDPLFERWMQAGGLQPEHAFRRVLAALGEGNLSLARYAARQNRSEQLKPHIERAISLYRDPTALLKNPKQLTRAMPEHRQILMLATERLRRRDLDQAIELWLRDRKRLAIPVEEQAYLTTRMGLHKAKRFEPDAEATLARLDPTFQLEELTEWRARLALTRLDWPEVERLIGKLPASKRAHERWQYWLGVARQRQGHNVSGELARLGTERTFYGFMAAELGGTGFTLNHEPIVLDAGALDRLEQTPAFQRMKELFELGELYDARSEWNEATAKMTPAQQHLAAHLVKRWGWHTQAIRGAIQSERWNDLDIRFPDPYPEQFERFAQRNEIPSTWATAIARQESAFWVRARSHAGALGLMQLMPATARGTAKRHGVPLRHLSALYEPETNIALGSAYLGEMYQRFGNNRVFATAAYNAGPHRVDRWLDARGKLPLDIWIETIPFDETRNYVQNVLAFGVIYDQRAGRPAQLLSERERSLLALNWPNGESL